MACCVLLGQTSPDKTVFFNSKIGVLVVVIVVVVVADDVVEDVVVVVLVAEVLKIVVPIYQHQGFL